MYSLLEDDRTVFNFTIEHRHIHISHACGMEQESISDFFMDKATERDRLMAMDTRGVFFGAMVNGQ